MDSVNEVGIETKTEGVRVYVWKDPDPHPTLGLAVIWGEIDSPAYLNQSQALQVIMHLCARYNNVFGEHSKCSINFEVTEKE